VVDSLRQYTIYRVIFTVFKLEFKHEFKMENPIICDALFAVGAFFCKFNSIGINFLHYECKINTMRIQSCIQY